MPHAGRDTLVWSPEHRHYAVQDETVPADGFATPRFRPGDASALAQWLAHRSSFAFVGQAGRLSVVKEARRRGGGYWYAYSRRNRRTRKRYLGPTAAVTFARLEDAAALLQRASWPTSPEPEPTAPSSTLDRESGGSLLATKLAVPRLSRSLVERARLLGALEAARAHPLTLVSASAGSGKTTLLAAWAAGSYMPAGEEWSTAARGTAAVAWLSLDDLDNDPIRFWVAVIAALRAGGPHLRHLGEMAHALLHSPEPPPLTTVLVSLLNDVERAGTDLILILDDYHAIADQTITESLLFMIDHLPATLHLVLATRRDPPFPLARWRVGGRLLEIRDQELRFTREEADRFLAQSLGAPLAEEQVAALEQRTGGWVAGMHLAALSLRTAPDRAAWIAAFTGSHRHVLDYVQQEILEQQPPAIQRFLLRVAVLTRMNAAVCQAVTGGAASQKMLETLERGHLLVVPLDEQRQWYRLHDLFREALLARLQAQEPELLPRLHQRAARWYEQQGELREAIVHALAAPDDALAASVLERAAPALWLSGEAQSVLTWLMALSDSAFCAQARLVLEAVRHVLDTALLTLQPTYARTLALVEQALGRLDTLVRRSEQPTAMTATDAAEDGAVAVVRRRLRLLRALLASRALIERDDEDGLRHLVEESAGLYAHEEVGWKVIGLWLTFRLTEVVQREGALLIPTLREAKSAALAAADHRSALRVMTWLAHAYVRAGRLHQAEWECREGLALAAQMGLHTASMGYVQYFLAETYYAWNRLDEAADCAQQMLRIGQTWQHVDLLVSGHVGVAKVALACGDLAAADAALQHAEALAQREGFAYHPHEVAAPRAWYWLAAGDLARAATWAAQTVVDPQAWDANQRPVVLMQVRVALAQRQYAQALALLDRWNGHLERPADSMTTSQFLALRAVTLHLTGEREGAAHAVRRLLALTESEGHLRVYLDAGPAMRQVLTALLSGQHADEPGAPDAADVRPHVRRMLVVFAQEEGRATRERAAREAGAATAAEVVPPPSAAPVSALQRALIEPLTPQEGTVLRLLVAGNTYAEMAGHLVVSPNTIKTQVSSIYRKLGVGRRAAAVEVAERLHLL
jgi:LuxR family maltose regulon positive regulatory protein